MTRDQLEPLLRLALVEGIGPQRLGRLIDRFGDAERAISANATTLRALEGFGPEIVARIRRAGSADARAHCTRALRRLDSIGAFALTPDDPLYPSAFLDLPDRPFLLFAAGEISIIRKPAVAIVGTRTPSTYGRTAAADLASELSLAGFSIVSGMARGVDSAAHSGALRAGGPTIGILGHGIEQVYPPENRRLFAAVRERGLLLTEFVPGETPKPGNFPRRNRLITAISRVVLVVEMGLRSGAQHTVNFALEQGREVMAVPGPIGSPSCEGTNQLIKDGARMVTSAADVLEELFGVGASRGLTSADSAARADLAGPSLALLGPEESRVYDALGSEPEHVDALATRAGLDAAALAATLLELELRGLVRSTPGMRYFRPAPSVQHPAPS